VPSLLLPIATVALLFARNCSPDNQDIGEATLFVWPIVALFALVVQRILLGLWQPLEPKLQLDARPVLIGIGVAVIAPVLVGATAKGNRWELWAFFMGWMFGATYTSAVLIATRVFLLLEPRWAEWGAHAVASLAFIPLAIVLTLERWPGAPSCLPYFLYLGYGGIATSCIFAVVIVEVVIRRARATSR
jgi:hypothetical protein